LTNSDLSNGNREPRKKSEGERDREHVAMRVQQAAGRMFQYVVNEEKHFSNLGNNRGSDRKERQGAGGFIIQKATMLGTRGQTEKKEKAS